MAYTLLKGSLIRTKKKILIRKLMEMSKKVANFVLNTLREKIHSLNRTKVGGITIRKKRLKQFRKKSKGLVIVVQIVASWYILILTGSYLTTDTGAYFNDVEKISEKIITAENFCEEKGSEYWHKYCNDNAGIGNGPDTSDGDTGEHTDRDNPGQNKGVCGDHTNAPCSEVTKIKETHTSNSISFSWLNPNASNKNFSHVKVYRNSIETPVGNDIINSRFVEENLLPSTKYSYKITTVDSSGNESSGLSIDVTTSNDKSDEQQTQEVPNP
jgi:predicted ribosomally synthesized peptide with SipW-like signal peptide